MDSSLTVEFVFGNISEELKAEAVQYWISSGAIKLEDKAKQRANELVAVCRGQNNELIGVSTHVKYFYAPLKNHFHLSRTFILDGNRNQGIMKAMFQEVWKNFTEKKLFLDEGIVGIMAVMENSTLHGKSEAIWKDYANAVLIGIDNRGFQIRGSYFEGAVLDLPNNV